MTATTCILRKGKFDPLYLIDLEREVSEALKNFGYDLSRTEITLKLLRMERCAVMANDRYIGVWDHHRKTFVD